MSEQKNLTGTEMDLCGIRLKNPVMTASGTFGYGYEMADWFDINILGGISLKGTTWEARFGNPTPRIAECASGMLNAIGLQNPGVQAVIDTELVKMREKYNGVAIANISGFSIEEYVKVTEKLNADDRIDILEINISCPNVKHGGMAFGTDATCAAEVVRALRGRVKKPMLIKLSPNVTSIKDIAKACAAEGADGLVVANTFLGMRIDPRTGKPIVSTGMCGFSGPAVKPIALRMVYEVCSVVDIPVVGVGGIADVDDVLEYISAGATAVQVGSQTLVDPTVCKTIIEMMPRVMAAYNIENLADIKGRAHKR